ncbi:MAG: hypothetical protein M3Z04_22150 [Chloroflexota bacterium]|nr:hypothetical protein [Chloroflexota bacterium]
MDQQDETTMGSAEAAVRRTAGLTPEGHPDENLIVDPASAVGSPPVDSVDGDSIHNEMAGFADAGDPPAPDERVDVEG